MLIGKVLTAKSRCLIINSILDTKIYTAAVFNRNLLVNQRMRMPCMFCMSIHIPCIIYYFNPLSDSALERPFSVNSKNIIRHIRYSVFILHATPRHANFVGKVNCTMTYSIFFNILLCTFFLMPRSPCYLVPAL